MYADDAQGMSIRLVTIYATRLRSNAALTEKRLSKKKF